MRELFNPTSEKGHYDQKDDLLVTAALSGNQQALEELISRHQGWIHNIAVRMLWNPQDAQDTTQEILLKIVTYLSSFRRESAFRTRAYRIVCNHVLNCRRRIWSATLKN